MTRFAIALGLALSSCAPDESTCMKAVAYTPCGNAQPGAMGSPPVITTLTMPTCALLAHPQVTGELAITDPDGDLDTLKVSFYTGPRQNEDETQLSGGSISGPFTIFAKMPEVGNSSVIVKATDKQGNQSVEYCGDFYLFRY